MIALSLVVALGCEGVDVNLTVSEGLTGLYFVKLAEEPAQVANTAALVAGLFGLDIIHTYDSVSEGFSAELPVPLIPEIEELEQVEYVVPDDGEEYVPPESGETDIVLGADEVPPTLAAIGGPYTKNADWSKVHVAVVDTGVDGSHPDLNVVAEEDLVGKRTGDRANGTDPNGHGTHVAGTIGAYADGAGLVGVAPGVPIHAVRVLGADGSGYFTDIVAGLEYVADNPQIRVVNLSLGGSGTPSADDPLAVAIQRLEDSGVVVAIAAGNEGQDTRGVVPAGFDLGVVVSAYDTRSGGRGFASFSNHGDAVDVAGPGVQVESTWPDGQYARLDGTSMATPHVAGAAAVYFAIDPTRDAFDFLDDVVTTGDANLTGADAQHPEPLVDLTALWATVGG